MSDITGILTIIDCLVDKGNTVIVIEYNLDIIRNADWIIDVGVEGGSVADTPSEGLGQISAIMEELVTSAGVVRRL